LNTLNNNLSKINLNNSNLIKYKEMLDYLKHSARYEVFLRVNK
jgi:hypothetical protein